MSDWKEVELCKLCTDISYGYTASATDNDTGFKFLRITDIQGGSVKWDSVPFCEIKEKDIEKNQLKYGDIVVARTGNSTGENYFFDGDDKTIFASYLIRFRIDENIANPYFVWQHLRSKQWWDYVASARTGSAQAGANAKVLGRFTLSLATIDEQNRIASFFSKINKKIQLNTETNQTLEAIAQALFKSWFIDFDPVRAKADALAGGKTEAQATIEAMKILSGKTSDQLTQLAQDDPKDYQQLQTTAEAFPSGFDDTGIPLGWESVKVEHIVKRLRNPKKLKKSDIVTKGKTLVLEQGADIFMGYHNDNPAFNATAENPIFIFGDHTCVTHISTQSFSIYQNVIAIIGKELPTYWVYLAIQGKQTFQEYRRHWKELVVKEVVVPDNLVLCEMFSEKIQGLYQKMDFNFNENAVLKETRNELLPKLLNGKI